MRLPAGSLGLEGKAAGSQNGDLNRRYTDQSSAGQVGGGLGGQFDAGKMSADSNGLFGYGFGNDSGQQRESDESESLERRSFGRYSANEAYRAVPENPFWRPIGEQAMSTFSIDVDTASYANVRRFLNEGSLPPAEAVRLEEFINYFHYNYPQPEGNEPFAVDLKLFGCPWNAQHSLLRVGLQGREIKSEKRPISNIVYLVDVSGSMSSDDKLPLLKRGLTMMVDHLSENDTVSIVTYAGDAGVRLEPTNGTNKKKILDAIDSLGSGGSTNGAAGIEAAYRLAQQNFVKDGANRVILMTDGDLNVGVTSDEALVALIKEKAASGVFLTVLGFGTGNLKDAKLEGLADNGNGIYGYIDSLGEAHKVLVEQMSGSLVTIAKDVKIQIEFNPAQVAGYRLIGYENRVMANQDFANDRKDAGDIGAGHTVTALYEIVPVGAMLDTTVADASSGLKYQTVAPVGTPQAETGKSELRLTEAAKSGELARVALRYKTPEGTESKLIEFTAKSEVTSFSQADADCRFAAAVAAFGMQLRQSQFAGNMTLDAIAEIASAATNNDPSGHRAEFVELVRRAKSLQTGYEK
jgi:secreted protein with Ig-like and vWFA domain